MTAAGPTFFDTHAHLDYPDFAEELPQIVARAGAAGITKIISIGTDLDSSRRAIKLAEQFPNVFAVVGWHPSHAGEAPSDLRPALRELARHPKVVALGETGLDYHRLPSQEKVGTFQHDQSLKRKQAQRFLEDPQQAAQKRAHHPFLQQGLLQPTLPGSDPLA